MKQAVLNAMSIQLRRTSGAHFRVASLHAQTDLSTQDTLGAGDSPRETLRAGVLHSSGSAPVQRARCRIASTTESLFQPTNSSPFPGRPASQGLSSTATPFTWSPDSRRSEE